MNIPNLLTLLRVFFVPILVVILLTKAPNKEIWGTIVFISASLTDFLDGYIARKKHQVTFFGFLIDPIADKLLISSAFISLVELHIVPAWMVVVIVGREFAVTGLRSAASMEKITIKASILGKVKMFFQVIAISLLLLGAKYGGTIKLLGKIMLWVVLIVAVVSMIQYFYKFWGKISKEHKNRLERRKKEYSEKLMKKLKGKNSKISHTSNNS